MEEKELINEGESLLTMKDVFRALKKKTLVIVILLVAFLAARDNGVFRRGDGTFGKGFAHRYSGIVKNVIRYNDSRRKNLYRRFR